DPGSTLMPSSLLSLNLRRAALAAGLVALALPAVAQQQAPTVNIPPAMMHGPASVADLAERLLGAVVNVSTSQNMPGAGGSQQPSVPAPQLPEASPFQDFFNDFFQGQQGPGGTPRRMQSLGSGFVIDAAEGIIVTNNHVIADADEIEVNFTDGSKLKA